jgi:hypothetical protein
MVSPREMWRIDSLPILGSNIILPTFHNTYQDDSEKLFLHKKPDDGCYFLVFHKKSINWRWDAMVNRPPRNLSLQFSQYDSTNYNISFDNISSICRFYPQFIFLKLNRDIEKGSANLRKIFVFFSSMLSVRLVSNGEPVFKNVLRIPVESVSGMLLDFLDPNN